MSADSNPAPGRDAIEFICDPELLGRVPQPERAGRFIPDWFRKLDRELHAPGTEDGPSLTVRACMPVADVFTLGYMLPLAFDLEIEVPEDRSGIETRWAEGLPFDPIVPHHPGQIGAPEEPFQTAMPLKFINPWRIVVPDGYSVLFTQPLSRPDLPFVAFSGLVDCDRFDTTVNIPFLWTGATGRHRLAAGTPIAQLVPIERASMLKRHHARASTEAEIGEQAAANHRKYEEQGAYTRDWRVRK